jgi:hypothetical protein
MGRMEIGEGKLGIVFPSHLRGKWDMYTESEELNATRPNELGVHNKKMITNNRYQESITKN